MNESLTFCSLYLHGVETKFTRRDRYYERDDEGPVGLTIFSTNIRPFGAPSYQTRTRQELDFLHWYILSNCDELSPYLR